MVWIKLVLGVVSFMAVLTLLNWFTLSFFHRVLSRKDQLTLAWRSGLQMQQTAIQRALRRHTKQTGEAVEFVRLIRPPLMLYISRCFKGKSQTWGLARTETGDRIVFLRGWWASDRVMPEFFELKQKR